MEFKVPSIEDIDAVRTALQGNTKRNCEMSACNVILWAQHYRTGITFYEGNLVFESHFSDEKISYSTDLLDADHPKELFDAIVSYCKMQKRPLQLHCMVEEEMQMIEQWYPGMYEIRYDRDAADYVYEREKLATLAGKKLHGKRNHIHRFEEQYPDWRYEPITEDNERECERMAMHWCMQNCMGEDAQIEYDKIDESKLVVYAIRHRKRLGMTGGALRAGGRIVAVTLGEPLTADMYVVHFEKAYADIQGAYPMINREYVRALPETFRYINREEDLGMEGLRKAKQSYRPVCMIEKGVIRETGVSGNKEDA